MRTLDAAFNIHNLVSIVASAEKPEYERVIKRLAVEYEHFLQSDVSDPALRIKIGPIDGRPQNYSRVDGRYLVNETALYCEDSYKVARWRILITGFDSDSLELTIEPNWFAKDLIPAILITPMISLQLMKKGHSLVHAAGIVKEESILITGFGGSGKTRCVFKAMDEGYRLLGDDHVILRDGRALSFPTALSLFSYNLPTSAWARPWRSEVKEKALLNWATFGYANLVTKASTDRLFANAIASDSLLGRVFLLQPSVCESGSVNRIEKEILVEAWFQNIASEIPYFFKYLFAYIYSNPGSPLNDYDETFKKLLLANLGNCNQFLKVVFPQDKSAEFLDHSLFSGDIPFQK